MSDARQPVGERTTRANRAVLWLLRSVFGPLLADRMTALRYLSHDGRAVTLPVQYDAHGSRLEVAVAGPERKTWWRHFRSPEPVEALVDGHWVPATGVLLQDSERAAVVSEVVSAHPSLVTLERIEVVEIELPAQARRPLSGLLLWRTWVPVVALGELVGFAAPLLVGILYDGWWPALLLAGAVEGALLGSAQAVVLAHILPALDRRRWIALTALAAVLAYASALIGVHVADVASGATRIVVPAVCGALVLASLGGAQGLELARQGAHVGRWILATAGAWLVALGAFMAIATPLWHEGQAPGATITIGVFAAAAMAYVQAAITGWGLSYVVRD